MQGDEETEHEDTTGQTQDEREVQTVSFFDCVYIDPTLFSTHSIQYNYIPSIILYSVLHLQDIFCV